MHRILEPEVMDTEADAVEYDAMDFREANQRFADDAIALLRGSESPQVLDIGTGTAQIPIMMLQREKTMRIVACDLAQEMLRVASRNAALLGVADRLKLARLDAKSLRLPDKKYDLVMCNSTIHHIPDPSVVFREIARVIKPSGAIVVRDLFRPESMDDAWVTVNRVAAGEHSRQKQLFFDSLCAALSVDEVKAHVERAGLERMHVERCSDRHWTAERPARAPSRRSVTP
ncbi:class I SAM-dependent methyltransferase [soil metagenome]